MAGRPAASSSTATQAETYLRVHAYPFLGNRPLGAVRRSEVQAWVKHRSEVLAPGSVEVVYRWVATIFKAAVGDRLIAASPCERIALPKRPPNEVVPLEIDAVERLVTAMPERYRALMVFAAGTGLRQGECFGLTVDRVDFLRRQVRVDRQLVSAVDGVPSFGPPKSQAGFRTVPLPEVVTEALAAQLSRFTHGPEGLIFSNTLGNPLRRSAFGETWHRAAATAGRERVPNLWCIGVDVADLSAGLISRLSGQRRRSELTCPVDGLAEHVRSRSREIAPVVVSRPLYRYRYTRCRGPGDVLAASHPDGSSKGGAVTDRTCRIGRHQPGRGLHLRIRQTVALGRHPVPSPRRRRLRGAHAAGRTRHP